MLATIVHSFKSLTRTGIQNVNQNVKFINNANYLKLSFSSIKSIDDLETGISQKPVRKVFRDDDEEVEEPAARSSFNKFEGGRGRRFDDNGGFHNKNNRFNDDRRRDPYTPRREGSFGDREFTPRSHDREFVKRDRGSFDSFPRRSRGENQDYPRRRESGNFDREDRGRSYGDSDRRSRVTESDSFPRRSRNEDREFVKREPRSFEGEEPVSSNFVKREPRSFEGEEPASSNFVKREPRSFEGEEPASSNFVKREPRSFESEEPTSSRSRWGDRQSRSFEGEDSSRSRWGGDREYPRRREGRDGRDGRDGRNFRERPRYFDNDTRNRRSFDRDYKEDQLRSPSELHSFDGDHIFGVSPVKAALLAGRRKFTELLIQSEMDFSKKKDPQSSKDIINIAKEKNIPIKEYSKHDLNMISKSEVHQGFVLRASELETTIIKSLEPSESFQFVLALDEVQDPHNLGALIRSSYFFGCDKIVLCAKNSAPLSSVVSKSSSGAMEFLEIYNAKNLMKFLDESKANGWQIVGTSLSEGAIDVQELDVSKPTILVLGNEGYGVRTNIINRCDQLIKIEKRQSPSSVISAQIDTIDSLNVSVTGGILIHQILRGKK